MRHVYIPRTLRNALAENPKWLYIYIYIAGGVRQVYLYETLWKRTEPNAAAQHEWLNMLIMYRGQLVAPGVSAPLARLLSQRLLFGLLVQRPLRFPTNPQKNFSGRSIIAQNRSISDDSPDRRKTQRAVPSRTTVAALYKFLLIGEVALSCRTTRTAADKEPEHLGTPRD